MKDVLTSLLSRWGYEQQSRVGKRGSCWQDRSLINPERKRESQAVAVAPRSKPNGNGHALVNA